ncbi:MAG: methylmalonyl-CoA mutase family protein, partial [Solirubrobacterales bacterium]
VEPDSRSSATYARTSSRVMTWVDPWVNMIRTTTATFAAGAAGAEFIDLARPAPGVEEVAGADDVVRDGVDMLITLTGALGRLGVK